MNFNLLASTGRAKDGTSILRFTNGISYTISHADRLRIEEMWRKMREGIDLSGATINFTPLGDVIPAEHDPITDEVFAPSEAEALRALRERQRQGRAAAGAVFASTATAKNGESIVALQNGTRYVTSNADRGRLEELWRRQRLGLDLDDDIGITPVGDFDPAKHAPVTREIFAPTPDEISRFQQRNRTAALGTVSSEINRAQHGNRKQNDQDC